jgi:hypothetical protein
MRLPRMTTRRWIAVVALVALTLGTAMEWRRWAGQRQRPGYRLASVIVAGRNSRQRHRGPCTGDPGLLVAITAAALVGYRLRRRFRPTPPRPIRPRP